MPRVRHPAHPAGHTRSTRSLSIATRSATRPRWAPAGAYDGSPGVAVDGRPRVARVGTAQVVHLARPPIVPGHRAVGTTGPPPAGTPAGFSRIETRPQGVAARPGPGRVPAKGAWPPGAVHRPRVHGRRGLRTGQGCVPARGCESSCQGGDQRSRQVPGTTTSDNRANSAQRLPAGVITTPARVSTSTPRWPSPVATIRAGSATVAHGTLCRARGTR